MELFELNAKAGSELSLGKEIPPIFFKSVLPGKATEKNLEDLLVKYPILLNWAYVFHGEPDLLIIGRQPVTQNRKRADLFAVSTDGWLVVIEIKRDALDEKGRSEGMEFQAIRYAAASRKMTADAIIDMYANYLKELGGTSTDIEGGFRNRAVTNLCNHLADEDEQLSEEDLDEKLDPIEHQRIYLVAAGYEPDVLSACAWLRQHEIEIACFRLCPYKIGDQLIMGRERLIPPPELDDFLDMMKPPKDSIPVVGQSARKSDRPLSMTWSNNPESASPVTTWKEVLVEGTRKALALGMELANLQVKNSKNAADLISPRELQEGLWIETNASAALIVDQLSKTFQIMEKPKGFLQIKTKSGKVIEVPDA